MTWICEQVSSQRTSGLGSGLTCRESWAEAVKVTQKAQKTQKEGLTQISQIAQIYFTQKAQKARKDGLTQRHGETRRSEVTQKAQKAQKYLKLTQISQITRIIEGSRKARKIFFFKFNLIFNL